ncbi:MAG: hypothetical protein CM15mP74_04340 [Halieaceae bacterium]|nr:MAG: hypothetical protein CM15mP74_04340 [Halieaceae bacterium]
MADHMQDEADLEALKRWWDENGKGIVAAVVVAVLGTVGWQQYQGFTAPGRRQPQIFTPRCWRIISVTVIPTHWRRWLLS